MQERVQLLILWFKFKVFELAQIRIISGHILFNLAWIVRLQILLLFAWLAAESVSKVVDV